MRTGINLFGKLLSLALILIEVLFSIVWYFFWIVLLIRQKTILLTR
jgi:hypothetical protein